MQFCKLTLPHALSSPGRVVVGRAKGNQLLQEDRAARAGRCGEHERLRLSVLPGSTFSSFFMICLSRLPDLTYNLRSSCVRR